VDQARGSTQCSLWKQYQQQCNFAIQIVEKEGSGALQLAHPKASALVTIQSDAGSDGENMDNQRFVSLMIERGTAPDSLKGKMEAAIVEAFRMEDNKTVQKLIKKKRKEQGIKEMIQRLLRLKKKSIERFKSMLRYNCHLDWKTMHH